MTLSYDWNDSQSGTSTFLVNRIAAGKTEIITIRVQSVNNDYNEIVNLTGSTSGILKLYDNFDFVNLIAETSCTVSNSNIEIDDLVSYPNPTVDVFQLKNDADIPSISIYSILGKQISTLYHTKGEVHNISILRTGMYLVRLKNQDGEIVTTIRMNKW